MADLVLCPSCARHARSSEPACPFCAGSLAEARRAAVNAVGRRAFTRAAVFTGAAMLLGTACSDPAPEREHDDSTGGGESTGGGSNGNFASDRDDGVGRDTHVTDEQQDEEVRVADESDDERFRREQEERERYRRPPCDEPACMTMPYGAPADRPSWV